MHTLSFLIYTNFISRLTLCVFDITGCDPASHAAGDSPRDHWSKPPTTPEQTRACNRSPAMDTPKLPNSIYVYATSAVCPTHNYARCQSVTNLKVWVTYTNIEAYFHTLYTLFFNTSIIYLEVTHLMTTSFLCMYTICSGKWSPHLSHTFGSLDAHFFRFPALLSHFSHTSVCSCPRPHSWSARRRRAAPWVQGSS